jgi:hypothetical protein
MDVIIWLANVVVMSAISFQLFRKENELRPYFWPALILKIAAGIFLGLLYARYYVEGDTFAYFSDSVNLADIGRKDFPKYFRFLWANETDAEFWDNLNFQQPRAIFFTKMASLLCFITADNYWLISTWFSFITFICSWFLIKELVSFKADLAPAAVFALLFFPSVVFWSAGFIKEAPALAMVYLNVTFFLRLWQKKGLSVIGYLLIPFSLWILWSLKYYYLAVLFPVMFAELIYQYVVKFIPAKMGILVRTLVWLVIFLLPLMFAGMFHPNFKPQYFLQVITDNNDAFLELSQENDVIQFSDLKPEVGSIIRNAPKAFFSGIFRPFVWEATTITQLLAAVENLLLTILAFSMIYDLAAGRRYLLDRIGWLVFIYSLILCVFLALSAPNFGTLSRYRVGFLPFFVMLLSYRSSIFDKVRMKLHKVFSEL